MLATCLPEPRYESLLLKKSYQAKFCFKDPDEIRFWKSKCVSALQADAIWANYCQPTAENIDREIGGIPFLYRRPMALKLALSNLPPIKDGDNALKFTEHVA